MGVYWSNTTGRPARSPTPKQPLDIEARGYEAIGLHQYHGVAVEVDKRRKSSRGFRKNPPVFWTHQTYGGVAMGQADRMNATI